MESFFRRFWTRSYSYLLLVVKVHCFILYSHQSPLLSIAYNSQHTYCTLYVPSSLLPYKILDSFRKMLSSAVRVPGKKSKILESSDCKLDSSSFDAKPSTALCTVQKIQGDCLLQNRLVISAWRRVFQSANPLSTVFKSRRSISSDFCPSDEGACVDTLSP